MNTVEKLEQEQIEKLTAERPVPEFRAGDTLRVHVKVVEGTRERIQALKVSASPVMAAALMLTSRFAKFLTVKALSVSSRCTPRVSTGLRLCVRALFAARSSYYLRELRGKKARIRERREDRYGNKNGE